MKNSRFYIYLKIGVPLFAVISVWLYFAFVPVVSYKEGVVYYLKPRTSKSSMIKELNEAGIIRHPYLFSIYVNMHPGAQLKTGEYLFPKGSSHTTIWKQMISGSGLYQRLFTIIPGWTWKQVKNALANAEGLRNLTKNMTDTQIMQALTYSDLPLEGGFFPETYYYTRDNPDLVLLQRAAKLMQERLDEAWTHRAPGLPYQNKYQALTAASLIEREAYLADEKPIIAGVLVNRLNNDMLLQFDPSVIYGMGERYQGKIRKKDLLDDTPYNTYTRKGLPPTPIGMPNMSSIDAALQPSKHDYLYFVAKGDGSHQFSKSLTEHKTAVELSRKKYHEQRKVNFN